MAFEKKLKNVGEQHCPICGREIEGAGFSFNHKGYSQAGEPICHDCLKRCYKNKAEKKQAGIIDGSSGFWFRLRPAPILEKRRFTKDKKEPDCGFEYAMPEICSQRILIDTAVYLGFLILIRLVWLGACEVFVHDQTQLFLSKALIDSMSFVMSAYICVNRLFTLIKGIFYGMGHLRRSILLITALVFMIAAMLTFPIYLTF